MSKFDHVSPTTTGCINHHDFQFFFSFSFFCLMLSDPVDSAPEPFTAPTTCSRCYRANNKTTRERERGSGGNRGDTSTHHHERAAGILKRPTGRLVNRIRTNWASTASTHKTQFYANEYEERKEKNATARSIVISPLLVVAFSSIYLFTMADKYTSP